MLRQRQEDLLWQLYAVQRASQLVEDYGFEVLDLVDIIECEKQETPLAYSRSGWKGWTSNTWHIKYR